MSVIRDLFPFFNSSTEVYLDTAATSQRLAASLEAMNEYYETFNANVHRGSYPSAIKSSNKFERARDAVGEFIGAQSSSELIFTSGATDALNLVANGLDIGDLQGRVILVCESEHHANLLPWQSFASTHNLKLRKLPLGKQGVFHEHELKQALAMLTDEVAILAIAHVSNVLGNIYPVEQLCNKAAAVNALSIIDGTQAAAHIPIDVSAINCDFYCLSGHKMYAGTGIGALYGKMKRLEKLKPSKFGGEMITHVTWEKHELQKPPTKFEAGTPNIAGALSLACAVKFIKQNFSQIYADEQTIIQYLLEQLKPLIDDNKIVLLGNIGAGHSNTISLLSFTIPNMHANDVAAALATQNIALRAGHHCAMPLMQSLKIDGCVRLSIGCYTTKNDIDAFKRALFVLFESGTESEIETEGFSSIKQTLTMSAAPSTIETALKNAPDWNNKHRLLLLHSKQLSMLHASEQIDSHEVAGCEAQVWIALIGEKLKANSNSKVVRGILAIIIEKVNALPSHEVAQFDINNYLASLGLSHYFSQGRRDGIQQIILRINALFTSSTLS